MSGLWTKLQHRLIDTHCHLLDYENRRKILTDLKDRKIIVHWVTTTLAEYHQSLKINNDNPNIHLSPGLFPLYADQEQHHFEAFLTEVSKSKLVGEVGLDYTAPKRAQKIQQKLFQDILTKCHSLGDRVLSIHSRQAGSDVLSMIGQNFHGTAIMHWFSGDTKDVARSPKNVFYSINSAMLKSRNGKEIINALRPEQVLTETDGPYVKINSLPSKPHDIRNVIQALSCRWNKPVENVLEIIEKNYQRAMNRPTCDDE